MVFSVIKRLGYEHGAPPTDNFVFKLCYRWTVWFLVVFSFIVTCKLWLGYSFGCIKKVEYYEILKCYEEGIYTLPTKYGFRNDNGASVYTTEENFKRYQAYYPWVNLLFLVQAFNFYLPHLLWRCYERGYMCRLTAGIQKFFDKEEKRGLELCYLAKYALVTLGKHKRYAAMYIFLETCNFAISLAQTLWLIYFFGVTGVPKYLPNVIETWSDFKHFYFPPEAFCSFKRYDEIDPYHVTSICRLPLNSLYMKMFLFLYAWYIFLTTLCGLLLVYRIILLIPAVRIMALKLSSPLAENSVLVCVCYCMSYSDWFFLSRLQMSMTGIDFVQMIDKISLVSQGKDNSRKTKERSSMYEGASKDCENSYVTSPV